MLKVVKKRVLIKLETLDGRRASTDLFRILLGRIPRDKALEGLGVQES